ncbi:MAG: CopG family antitoxin [Thermomicrobiales bacterium]
MVQETERMSKIPKFTSIEEEAAFWDNHDSTEFEEEFEPVEIQFAHPLLHSLLVDFDGATFDRVVVAAKQRGIGPAALVHLWTTEALEQAESGQHGFVRKSS